MKLWFNFLSFTIRLCLWCRHVIRHKCYNVMKGVGHHKTRYAITTLVYSVIKFGNNIMEEIWGNKQQGLPSALPGLWPMGSTVVCSMATVRPRAGSESSQIIADRAWTLVPQNLLVSPLQVWLSCSTSLIVDVRCDLIWNLFVLCDITACPLWKRVLVNHGVQQGGSELEKTAWGGPPPAESG